MANYFPFQRLDFYNYDEATKILSIKSQLQVYLAAGETIDILEPLELNPFTFTLELNVIQDLNQGAAYLWEGEKLIEINSQQIYAANTPAAEKVPAVKTKVNLLLETYRSTYFYVTAVVRATAPNTGGQVTNTISGSGAIDI